ncbi:uracil-DNA glycosylase family protein [Methylobacillus methanolivorans]|uniref:Type-4 uracil-DNA glycosylase n=1 Tax=Methylobacillus methanolivorans TaxID=1848927 RepID=A0ABW8GQ75_9PROT
MGLSRDDMLRELELLPVWRLRHPPALAAEERQEVAESKPEQPAEIKIALEVETAAPERVVASEPAQEVVPVPVQQPVDSIAVDSIAPQQEPAEEMSGVLHDAMPLEAEYFEAMQSWPEFADSVMPADMQAEVAVPQGDRRTAIMSLDWQGLQQNVQECEACNLAQTRTQTVFGVGDPNAEWLLIGEAPGAEEDRRGEPFVGPAGQLLDNMLAAIALKRGENVYIANVLKCRPPANRDPHGEEVVQCDPYLKRQVELIKPKLIVALGKFAAQSLLASDSSIASLRGKLHDFHGVPVIVTYHPAYLLRNLPDKAKAWDDLCFARETMHGLQSAAVPPSGT